MSILLDTNIAIRIVLKANPLYEAINAAVLDLIANGDSIVVSAQILGECWNLSTRPSESRGGYGLAPERAAELISDICALAKLLPEPPSLWDEQLRLLIAHQVSGVRTHDCRTAAWCMLSLVDTILTLNERDFARYGLQTINPALQNS